MGWFQNLRNMFMRRPVVQIAELPSPKRIVYNRYRPAPAARVAIILSGIERGLCWREIANEIGKAEDRTLTRKAAQDWAHRRGLDVGYVPHRKGCRRKYVHPTKHGDLIAQVCALKGKKSAAKIAREMNFASRNVVIGIWHRNIRPNGAGAQQ